MAGPRLVNRTPWTVGVAWGGGQGAAVLLPGAAAPMPTFGGWNHMQGGLLGLCETTAALAAGSTPPTPPLLQLVVGPAGASIVASTVATAPGDLVVFAPQGAAWPFEVPSSPTPPKQAVATWNLAHGMQVVCTPSAVTFQLQRAQAAATTTQAQGQAQAQVQPCSVTLSTSTTVLVACVAGAFVVLIFGCVCLWGWTTKATAARKRRVKK
jgi:hypothetical protein